jgi:hypothetical protein
MAHLLGRVPSGVGPDVWESEERQQPERQVHERVSPTLGLSGTRVLTTASSVPQLPGDRMSETRRGEPKRTKYLRDAVMALRAESERSDGSPPVRRLERVHDLHYRYGLPT